MSPVRDILLRFGISVWKTQIDRPHRIGYRSSSPYYYNNPSTVFGFLLFFFQILLHISPIMHPDSQLKGAVTKGFDPKLLYNPHLDHVGEPVRTILEEYSNIPADKILQHVR